MQYLNDIIPKIPRGQRRQKGGGAISRGGRIEPATLRCQDPAARTYGNTVVQLVKKKKTKNTKDNGDRKEFFRARKSATGNGIAGPRVQNLNKIVPEIRKTKRRQNGVFPSP